MLKLKNITKSYKTGEFVQTALKDLSLEFRENEFVAILGSSGSGKTTLLNIIGGLDRYDSGDLIIKGKSTKKFKSRDWDTYRNNSVGFVFQSYNLITHISVLANVEMSMTLSGVKAKEKRKRALEVLERVGLKEHAHKKPNQLSGGQMQRVAIARALVNNPEIILADEPTGALDSTNSVQIMELIKEIAKDKLVIMVTHNPELVKDYATRIVKVKDGEVIDDTDPYEEKEEEKEVRGTVHKTSMSFFTALSLSLNNLLTKKGRTFLTAFAGSIGIIGIALILSLSTGVNNYINKLQEDTLSSYPLTIQEESIDMSSMMLKMMESTSSEEEEEKKENTVHSNDIMSNVLSTISNKVQTNNLKEFKDYIENKNLSIKNNSNAIQYLYNMTLNIYSSNVEDGIVKVNPSTVFSEIGFDSMMPAEAGGAAQAMTSTDVWVELLDNRQLLESQYDVVAGKMPNAYNEVVLIVDENNEISDYTLYSLGLKDIKELKEAYNKLLNGETVEEVKETLYSYDDLLGLKFKLLLNTDYYKKENGIWADKTEDEEYMKEKIKNAEDLTIVGILKINEESAISSTTGVIGYLKDLKEYVINKTNDTEIVKAQKENEKINVFTGLEFTDPNSKEEFDYSKLSDEQKMYLATLSKEELAELMAAYSANSEATYKGNLIKLGAAQLDKPSAINIYPKDFEAKETIKNAIQKYNEIQENAGKNENIISYTDMVGTLMSSVTTIVNVITYVLVAFVSISLVVSSIMIGIITYISVLERTKEIGILRAIGASKKDISRVFNAETFIVGLASGAIGIGVTLLLNIPINFIIKELVGISGVSSLPVKSGIALVIISMVLTVVAGLIPAKIAAKKDPVEALRTE